MTILGIQKGIKWNSSSITVVMSTGDRKYVLGRIDKSMFENKLNIYTPKLQT
jgi:hypothetical protein